MRVRTFVSSHTSSCCVFGSRTSFTDVFRCGRKRGLQTLRGEMFGADVVGPGLQCGAEAANVRTMWVERNFEMCSDMPSAMIIGEIAGRSASASQAVLSLFALPDTLVRAAQDQVVVLRTALESLRPVAPFLCPQHFHVHVTRCLVLRTHFSVLHARVLSASLPKLSSPSL